MKSDVISKKACTREEDSMKKLVSFRGILKACVTEQQNNWYGTLGQARLLGKPPVGDATWAANLSYVSGSSMHLR